MRSKVVAGNWKLNGSLAGNDALLKGLLRGVGREPKAAACVVCVPTPYLAQVRGLLEGSAIGWGAQDVSRFDQKKLNTFKYDLYRHFGIESSKYENNWDYEQYLRLAQPAVAALHALGAGSALEPCVILSHEYMGMPTALAAIMEGDRANFRTIFYAH